MGALRDKRKAFKEYATRDRLNKTLGLMIEYGEDYPKLDLDAMIEDFLNFCNRIVLIQCSTEVLFNEFLNMYSKKYMYLRFLRIK